MLRSFFSFFLGAFRLIKEPIMNRPALFRQMIDCLPLSVLFYILLRIFLLHDLVNVVLNLLNKDLLQILIKSKFYAKLTS